MVDSYDNGGPHARIDEEAIAHDPLAGLEALATQTSTSSAGSSVGQEDSLVANALPVPHSSEGTLGVGEQLRLVPSPAGSLAAAINYWCAAYQVSCADMHSIAECESTYGRDPNAYNGSSGFWGAFQFHPSTWLSTPPGQRGELATDDWAAAEGAAWMLSVGRRGEWPGC